MEDIVSNGVVASEGSAVKSCEYWCPCGPIGVSLSILPYLLESGGGLGAMLDHEKVME